MKIGQFLVGRLFASRYSTTGGHSFSCLFFLTQNCITGFNHQMNSRASDYPPKIRPLNWEHFSPPFSCACGCIRRSGIKSPQWPLYYQSGRSDRREAQGCKETHSEAGWVSNEDANATLVVQHCSCFSLQNLRSERVFLPNQVFNVLLCKVQLTDGLILVHFTIGAPGLEWVKQNFALFLCVSG